MKHLPIFLVAILAASCGQRPQNTQFHAGREQVIGGQYQEAMTTLSNYLEENPNGKHASRAQFFIAKAE